MRKHNSLLAIQGFGQSVWLEYIRRRMLSEGELQQMIAQDGLRGVTSNPLMLEQVIAHSGDYNEDLRLMARQGRSEEDIYDALTIKDIGMAADQLRPLYERSDGRHGFVSLEINPHLAYDEEGTLEEARRLWSVLDRPNVMIKIPATDAGLKCFRELVREAINVNLTLMFGLQRCREAADVYIEALESRASDQKPVTWIASVASFFVGRLDAMVDDLLDHREELPEATALTKQIYGRSGVAIAKQAYQMYQKIFNGERFAALREKGALPMRLVWADDGTRSVPSQNLKYVEALIGPDTIVAMSRDTLKEYRAKGSPEERLTEDLQAAEQIVTHLRELDINIEKIARSLEEQGIEGFIRSYDRLMETIGKARYDAL
jgi:transaldolase